MTKIKKKKKKPENKPKILKHHPKNLLNGEEPLDLSLVNTIQRTVCEDTTNAKAPYSVPLTWIWRDAEITKKMCGCFNFLS